MTKGELIAHLAHQYPHSTPQAVEMMLNALLEQVATTMAQGERIELRGFGSFTVRDRAVRTGRNPRTGASVAVAARRAPFVTWPRTAMPEQIGIRLPERATLLPPGFLGYDHTMCQLYSSSNLLHEK